MKYLICFLSLILTVNGGSDGNKAYPKPPDTSPADPDYDPPPYPQPCSADQYHESYFPFPVHDAEGAPDLDDPYYPEKCDHANDLNGLPYEQLYDYIHSSQRHTVEDEKNDHPNGDHQNGNGDDSNNHNGNGDDSHNHHGNGDDHSGHDSGVDVCKLPKKVGPCKAAFQRYYYDCAENKCKKFVYGGCEGNANNFLTLQSCEKKCCKK